MKKSRKWIAMASMGLVVLALTAVALPVAAAQNEASTVAHGGGPNGFGDRDSYLAETLGITVAELQTAQQSAQEIAIQQAVDEGLITQAQADALLARSGTLGRRDWKGSGGFWGSSTIDREALLANALGIDEDELQAAHAAARTAALQKAVDDGAITQEQADLMDAQQELRDFLNEQGLQAAMESLYTDAVQGAVESGVITQDQADTILSSPGPVGKSGGMRGFEFSHGSRPLPDGMRNGGLQGIPGF
jgi:hypothetical protein